jgi:hypothetical protein
MEQTLQAVADTAASARLYANDDDARIDAIGGVPSQMSPGTINMTVDISVSPVGPRQDVFGPDACEVGLLHNGVEMDVELYVDGTLETTVSDCYQAKQTTSEQFTIDLLGEGTREIEIVLRGSNSGNVIGRKTETVQVQEDSENIGAGPGDGIGGGGGNSAVLLLTGAGVVGALLFLFVL